MTVVMEQRTFQSGVPVVARRDFMCSGQKFRTGQPFPWEQFGFTPEKVDRMFRAKWLRHDLEAVDLDRLDIRALQSIARKRGVPTRRSRADQLAELRAAE